MKSADTMTQARNPSAGGCSAFADGARVAAGSLAEVVSALRARDLDPRRVLVFDDRSGEAIRLNSDADIAAALAPPPPARPPSSAPVELTVRVLPRHAAWLDEQPGGRSAAIRRLLETARRDDAGAAERAKQAAYRFISMLAGDFPGYEDACRALFAGDGERFAGAAAGWPDDIFDYARELAAPAFT
jgi:hypothetical protein